MAKTWQKIRPRNSVARQAYTDDGVKAMSITHAHTLLRREKTVKQRQRGRETNF